MAAVKTDHALERMVFFSDAVFAIAITLLVIELHAPQFPRDTSDLAHIQALANLVPNFVGFAVSFAVIGMFWMGHHRAFSLAAHYSPRVLGWNLTLLGMIAFMPFVTAYLSSNIFQRVPAIFYCLVMLAAALLNLKVNRTATSAPMVDESAIAGGGCLRPATRRQRRPGLGDRGRPGVRDARFLPGGADVDSLLAAIADMAGKAPRRGIVSVSLSGFPEPFGLMMGLRCPRTARWGAHHCRSPILLSSRKRRKALRQWAGVDCPRQSTARPGAWRPVHQGEQQCFNSSAKL